LCEKDVVRRKRERRRMRESGVRRSVGFDLRSKT